MWVDWVLSSLGDDDPEGRSLRLRLHLGDGGDDPRVETWHATDWVEIKAGLFRWVDRGPNALLLALDDGWDLDGRWTETSSLALVRVGQSEVEVVWTRILHNEHLPETLEGRTLTAVAQGTLRRLGIADDAE